MSSHVTQLTANEVLVKHPDTDAAYNAALSTRQVPEGDEILLALFASVSPAGELTVPSVTGSGRYLQVELRGGVAGQRYMVQVDVTTRAGAKFPAFLKAWCKDV